MPDEIRFRSERDFRSTDLPARYPEAGDDLAHFGRYARALWDEQNEAMRPLFNVWMQNLLFLSNRQHWQLVNGSWQPSPAPEWKAQSTSNLSLAYFKNFLAKATKVRPAWQVRPKTAEPDDIRSAELAGDVLEAKWYELRMNRVVREAVAWAIATGNAFFYPYFDPSKGDPIPLTCTVETAEGEREAPCDENGDLILLEGSEEIDWNARPAMVREGDVAVKVFSGFQVRVNADAENDDAVREVQIGEVVTLREAVVRFPSLQGRLTSEDVSELDAYSQAWGWAFGGGDTQMATPFDERDRELGKVLVIHHHEAPSDAHPEGRYWLTVGDGLVPEEPQALPDGIWPVIVHLEDVHVPGRYYAMSTLESVVGLNREYNDNNSDVRQHHRMMCRGKWLVEKGSGVKQGAITDRAGEVIQVNPGFRVTQVQIQQLPSAVYQERERILSDFQLVSGVNKVSMGQAPPGVTSGVGFLQLQEADDSDLGPFLACLEESIAALAGMILQIIRNRYVTERLVRMVGANKRFLVRSFRGADLNGVADVVPVAESSFPWSKTARANLLIQMAGQLPWLFVDENGQPDKATFARQLPFGGLDALTDLEDLDAQEAAREEEMLETFGIESQEMPAVEEWQNHAVHLKSHAAVLKSAKFRQWPPQNQQLLIQHYRETLARLQAAMAPPPGTAPGGEGAPGGLPGGAPGEPPLPEDPAALEGLAEQGPLGVPEELQDPARLLDPASTPTAPLSGVGPVDPAAMLLDQMQG